MKKRLSRFAVACMLLFSLFSETTIALAANINDTYNNNTATQGNAHNPTPSMRNEATKAIDAIIPTISTINTNGLVVEVIASDDVALAPEAYSFNGGWSWQASNTYTAAKAMTFGVSGIQVRDTAGNINYNRTEISVAPIVDTVLPVISSIDTKGMTVSVTASDNVALAPEAYSFNGGWSWQASNTYTAAKAMTFGVSGIQVRDTAGNINYNRTEISVAPIADKVPPVISINAKGMTVSVTASDNVALAPKAYSFNGGWSWQASNTYTAAKAMTFGVSGIQVRDEAGNIEYNRTEISLPFSNDKVPPTISINAKGMTVSVTASDNVALAPEAYSFNGGWSWQASNTYTAAKAMTFGVSGIQVRDEAGNIEYNRASISLPFSNDKVPPTISINAKGMTVSVTASDNVALAPEAYSFNGGWSWQASNTYTAAKAMTFGISAIQVRDAAGNIEYNRTEISLPFSNDKTPPVFSIVTRGLEIKINAQDNVLLAKEAYSFNGGWSWQSGNKFTFPEAVTLGVSAIQVRDDAGNIEYNREPIVLPNYSDKVPPSITISDQSPRYGVDKSIVVSAFDNDELAAEAYSFNGGYSWQASNRYDVNEIKSFGVSGIQVRDVSGNIAYNQTPVYIDRIIKVINEVGKTTLSVMAADNGWGQAPAQYSINGGWTWQTSNNFVFEQSTTIGVSGLQVKDASGRVNYNDQPIKITIKYAPKGIDVSSYQGHINWKQVADSGVTFAILRAMVWSGNASSGGYVVDPYFYENVEGAKANGVKVGAYIYSTAFNEAEIRGEVDFFVNMMAPLKASGFAFDLPVYVDYEDKSIVENIGSYDRRTELLKYEMDLLSANGYHTGMYMNLNWARNIVDAASLQNQGYDLWLAQWGPNMTWTNGTPAMWQYSNNGSVPGISGRVDLDYVYKDYSYIKGSAGGGITKTYTVYDINSQRKVTDTMLNILAGIVNNEVGGGLGLTGMDKTALWKAQAVAAHSWLLYHYENQNTTPSVGLKTDGSYESVKDTVYTVQDKVALYGNRPINAMYGASCNGYTNSAAAFYGTAVPYLTNVDSHWEREWSLSGSLTNKTYTSRRSSIEGIVGASAVANTSPENWVSVTRDNYGYVTSVRMCGQNVSVANAYDNLYGVVSGDFNPSYVGGENWKITNNGKGHCIGMSQWGAAAMVANGYSWDAIVRHYYPGTTISSY